MLQKTKGIVLKSVKYSETSLICKVFTEQLGMRSYMISGVRATKSVHKPALLQPLSLLDMVAYESAKKKINRLKEFKLSTVFQTIPFDILKSTTGLFMTEILSKTLKEEAANLPLFAIVEKQILFLDETEESIANFPIYFLLELSRYLGFYPQNNYSEEYRHFDMENGRFTGEHLPFLENPQKHGTLSRHLSFILGQPQESILHYKILPEDRRALLTLLLQYYECHLPNFGDIQSVGILQEVLS